jgi:undecaprenyl-diphosphatase
MSLLRAVILGMVQGLTEFLPISSIAHLRIVSAFLGWDDPGAAFSAVIQLGTLLAVVIYFRKDLGRLLHALLRSIWEPQKRDTIHARLSWFVFSGTIPIVVFGLLFQEVIEGPVLRSLEVIGVSLVTLAVVMLIAESWGRRRKEVEDLSLGGAVFIGCAQALALIPGMSRSASTITAGLFAGLTSHAAARFSFLLGTPAIFLAGVFEFTSLLDVGLGAEALVSLFLGGVSAFAFGYLAIDLLLKFLESHTLRLFVAYRILLGALLLALAASGVIFW